LLKNPKHCVETVHTTFTCESTRTREMPSCIGNKLLLLVKNPSVKNM